MQRSMLRAFFCLFAVMALLLSPSLTGGATGMAMAHSSTVAASGLDGHCDGSTNSEDSHHSREQAGCTAGCAAVAPTQPLTPGVELFPASTEATTSKILNGIFPEGEKPPPRITPEI